MSRILGTTICAVKKGGSVAISGDGQASLVGKDGTGVILKGNSKKVRRIYGGRVAAGFAGSVADAMALLDLFETKLNDYRGDLERSAMEFARMWRTDKTLRNLEAEMLVTDGKKILLIAGNGNVIEPEYDVAATGSGGMYALAAARAFLESGAEMSADEISSKSVEIAADICIYTNHNIITEVIDG